MIKFLVWNISRGLWDYTIIIYTEAILCIEQSDHVVLVYEVANGPANGVCSLPVFVYSLACKYAKVNQNALGTK